MHSRNGKNLLPSFTKLSRMSTAASLADEWKFHLVLLRKSRLKFLPPKLMFGSADWVV